MCISAKESDFSSKEQTDEPLTLERLFGQYYARLVYFSFQITKDKNEAEDIVQEAFIRYWNQKEEVAGQEAAIKGFLYSTVKNASLNAVRHSKVVELYKTQAHVPEIDEADIVQAMIRSEVVSEIHRAIETLPESCQRVARMGFLENRKNHEIAAELDISVNTVKTQKKRGLQLLRLRLNPELFSLLLLLTNL